MKKVADSFEWLYPDQKMIADYMHRYTCQDMRDVMDFEAAMKVALNINDGGRQARMLMHIYEMSVEFYHPSRKYGSLTPRMFGMGLQYLKKEVRRALLPFLVDLDLQNYQLATVGGRFNVPSIQNLDGPVWPILLDYMGIPEDHRVEAKSCVKTATYSTIFGMRRDNVEAQLQHDLSSLERPLTKEKAFTESQSFVTR